jgi:hypothetical protein
VGLALDGRRFDDGHAHIERAMSYTANDAQNLGYAMMLQAVLWYGQHRVEEARSEARRVADIFEKLGFPKDVASCGELLRVIHEGLDSLVTSGQLREFLQMVPVPTRINFPFQAQRTDGRLGFFEWVPRWLLVLRPLAAIFFDTTTPTLPFVHLLHSHTHRFTCVVLLFIVNSHPELSVSPSPSPCLFRTHVHRRLPMMPNRFSFGDVCRFGRQHYLEKPDDAMPHAIIHIIDER